MANFYEDNDDLRFYVERGIDWEPLVSLTEYRFKSQDGFKTTTEAVDFYKDVLNLVGQFVADDVAPRAAEIDKQKPKLVDGEVVDGTAMTEIMAQIKELELHGMCAPRELGGMNCPIVIFQLCTEIFSRADVSATAHYGFHGGIAMAMLAYSVLEGTTEVDAENARIVRTRFQEYVEEILRGEAWGSMDLTEPHAGSDLAALRTRGEVDEKGNWTVTGSKVFITSGHGKYHFVIARTEEAKGEGLEGLNGLSLFLVPAWSTGADGKRVRHVRVDSLEEKLGHHGSATCALSFEKAPAFLVGKRGEGFQMMLLMMNGARVGVGFESLGLSEAALRIARAYAAERPSMGKTIDKHEMIADYLDEMRTEIQGVRALAMKGGINSELAQKLNLELTYWPPDDPAARAELERQHLRAKRAARAVTPLVKYAASENAVKHARRCIQILGGSGYMRDYGAEKLLRDAAVFPIYEGTSQIQALMAMKDTLLDIVKRPQSFVRKAAAARWRSVGAKDPLERRLARLESIQYATLRFLLSRLAANKLGALREHGLSEWVAVLKKVDPKRDFALAMLHAERLAQILVDVAIATTLFEQATAFPERRELLERWLERAEPRCRFLHDEITTTGLRLLGSLDERKALDAAAK